MVYEKSIQVAIKNALREAFPKMLVDDVPFNLNDYIPSNSEGEILISSYGYQVSYYTDASNKMNLLSFGSIAKYETRWQVLVLMKDIITLDRLYDLTSDIIETVEGITEIFDQDSITEKNPDGENIRSDLFGTFFDTDVSMPTYDDVKEYQWRSITFVLPVLVLKSE